MFTLLALHVHSVITIDGIQGDEAGEAVHNALVHLFVLLQQAKSWSSVSWKRTMLVLISEMLTEIKILRKRAN